MDRSLARHRGASSSTSALQLPFAAGIHAHATHTPEAEAAEAAASPTPPVLTASLSMPLLRWDRAAGGGGGDDDDDDEPHDARTRDENDRAQDAEEDDASVASGPGSPDLSSGTASLLGEQRRRRSAPAESFSKTNADARLTPIDLQRGSCSPCPLAVFLKKDARVFRQTAPVSPSRALPATPVLISDPGIPARAHPNRRSLPASPAELARVTRMLYQQRFFDPEKPHRLALRKTGSLETVNE